MMKFEKKSKKKSIFLGNDYDFFQLCQVYT